MKQEKTTTTGARTRKFNKLEQGWPVYNSGEITSAYELEDDSKVGYCKATREWLKWRKDGTLHNSFGKTRAEAAKLTFDDEILYPMKKQSPPSPDQQQAGKLSRSDKKRGILARIGRNFVQKSLDPSWPKYAVFGANPSRWHDTLGEAIETLRATARTEAA